MEEQMLRPYRNENAAYDDVFLFFLNQHKHRVLPPALFNITPRELNQLVAPQSMAFRLLLRNCIPYLELIRWDKPTGTNLMFWPFAWGLTMAAYDQRMPVATYVPCLAGCLFAAFIIRSSACTVNDIFDRNFDAQVQRTKNRPLPSGRISVKAASVYLLGQYLIGVSFFCSTMHDLALQLALFQLVPLFGIYPLMKRLTNWPQAWLGVAMNFGFVTAWVSQNSPSNNFLIVVVMMGCWCWTMMYDTIYACQDIQDDVKAGVHSSAIAFGSWIRPMLFLFGLTFFSAFLVAGALNHHGLAYYVISIGGLGIHLAWQCLTVDLDSPKSCWDNFQSNGTLGLVIWGGILVDYLYSCSRP
ncbi:hypothetical protein E4T56_gene13413 [Termitomyces sp. T112]|nr:hypothetical protein E4T56_gene13413 [Termitomyces sp. T112]